MENERELSFEELYNESLKETKLDRTVTGRVISITSKGEIFVDIGYKADGIIPKAEYSFDDAANPSTEFKIGDEITADVVKQNDGLGNVLLSYKRVKIRESKKELERRVKDKDIFEEKVIEANEKGLILKIYDMRVFIPLSLSGISKSENYLDYIGKNVRFRITEYEPKTRKIIGSMKSVLDEEKEVKLKEFWDNVEIGNEYEGIVSSISSYGAFIDINGVQGLLHISELSWVRNVKAEDILKQGQSIEVIVIDADKENRRLKLSYREKGPNPWNKIDEKYHINDVIKAKVVKMMPFGVFLEIQPGIEGLVHISQITEKKISKPEEILSLDKHINVKIIDIDKENKKIELSIKELEGTSNEYIEE